MLKLLFCSPFQGFSRFLDCYLLIVPFSRFQGVDCSYGVLSPYFIGFVAISFGVVLFSIGYFINQRCCHACSVCCTLFQDYVSLSQGIVPFQGVFLFFQRAAPLFQGCQGTPNQRTRPLILGEHFWPCPPTIWGWRGKVPNV